jgi:cytochrome c oxidase subunit 4
MAHHADSTSKADESHGDKAHGAGDHGTHHAHGTTEYWMVFFVLMVLLLLTVYASFINLRWANVPIAYTIAIIKAALILWFFMHLKQSTRLSHVFAFSSFAWLALMLIITMGDYFSRHILGRAEAETHIRQVDSWPIMSGISDTQQKSEAGVAEAREKKGHEGAGHGDPGGTVEHH